MKRLITYTPNMQWEFEIQMKTVPSEKNYMRIYLYMENAETYYYVQIGCKKEKNDKVEKKIGLRRNGGVDMFDRKESSLDSKTHLSIKVTLEDNKYWKMYSRNINDKYYKEEGSCTYPIANAPVSGYFIINMIYTGSRNKHFLMDNIRISDEITPTITDSDETPVDPDDPDVPSVEMPFPDVEIVSLSELQFNFESPVDISNANSFISGIGKADYLKYGDTKAVVNAGFPKDMTPGESYIISFTGLTDLSGKSLNLASEEFKLEDEGNDPVYVMLDDPNNARTDYSSILAAPVVGNIISEIAPYLGIATDGVDRSGTTVKVPNLTGKEWSNAQVQLNIKGLKHHLAESESDQTAALVTYQYPRAGAEVPYGTTVYLYTDTYEGKHAEVPDVTGKSADFARQMLNAAGLNCTVEGSGTVQSQSEAPGSSVQRGTIVHLICG